MSHACPLLSHLLCVLALCSCASGARAEERHLQRREDGDGAWTESVARARCASRCIGLSQNDGSMEKCGSNKQCSTCLEPCKASWEIGSSCAQMCETTFPTMPWECESSCRFLESALSVKQGLCPSPDQAQGFEAACVPSCDQDQDCPRSKKCCSNGCGRTCQNPIETYTGVPLKPRKELQFSEEVSGKVEVRWSSRFNVSVEPVVYILQRRWNYGIQPSEDSATAWQEVAQTSASRLQAPMRPGRWYQFRVAAVNSQGTRGFTTPSRHVHSSREPSAPAPPSGLRLSQLTFTPGGTATAHVLWDPPVDLDLDPDQDQTQDSTVDQRVPAQFYSVTWSCTSDSDGSGTRTRPAERKKRKTVREVSLSLPSLRVNRTYSVEVQALSFWRQNLLKSPKSMVRFSTASARVPPAPGASPSERGLNVGTPFFQDGQLRVQLYWKHDPLVQFYKVQWIPEHCSANQTELMEKTVTQETFTSLSPLLFSCKYSVSLRTKTGLKSQSWSKPESRTFWTPSCASVQNKSQTRMDCSRPSAEKVFLKNMRSEGLDLKKL